MQTVSAKKWRPIFPLVILISASSVAVAQQLPPGGTTAWEIQEVQAIVTFLLFDPKDPAVDLPSALRFVSLREVAVKAPESEFEEHLKHHPEHSDWAFSFIEFVRPKGFLLDGKALTLSENGAIAVWLAPVDHSQLASEVAKDKFETVIAPSPDALLVLGFWVPDREYVAHVRARGHHAEYGMVTLVKDGKGAFQGEMKLAELNIKTWGTPQGEARSEPDPFTQVWFEPGERVERAVILAGGNAREQDCTAEWSKEGDHALSRGVLLGPTFLVVEGPFKGSAYRLQDEKKQ